MRIGTVLAASVCCMALVTMSPTAAADPGQMCRFAVSVPQREAGPGGTSVIATTFTVESCPGTWQPTRGTVCLVPATGGGTCTSVYGWGPGRVTVPAAAAPEAFTATGQGCARINGEIERCEPATTVSAGSG